MKTIILTIILSTTAYFFGVYYGQEQAEPPINVEILADAIYRAEGGELAVKPYGILSVPCSGETSCRNICKNTIRNNIKRYEDYGHKKHNSYLSFLASRYAPLNVKNDPTGLNRHWIDNVSKIYKQLAKE